ncbi:hypothetical protein GGI20_002211 [Coemansia sp. BCRC 34301]|nr:hypothetical protein GGI20_002211 [Coemansia sp. BCRC 34301]
MVDYSGADVIELLSDDDDDDSVLEVMPVPGRTVWPSSTPSTNRTGRVINILTPGTPDTPDLPSPSALLGALRGHGALSSGDSGRNRQALTPTRTHQRLALLVESDSSIGSRRTLLSMQAALDLPSSPPPPETDFSDEHFDVFGGNRSFAASPRLSPPSVRADDEGLDDGQFLDDIIDHQTDFVDSPLVADDRSYTNIAASEFQFGLDSSSLYCRPYAGNNGGGAWRRGTASVEYSDAVATEIIDSSSDDDEAALEPRQSVRALQALSTIGNLSSSFGLFSSRSPSAELDRRSQLADVLSVSTDPSTAGLPSERSDHPIVRALSSSSSAVHRVALSRKESSTEQRRIEAERKRAERAAEKERREREKETQRGIGSVNKKQVDQRVLARDMTVVADPGLLALFKEPKRATVPAGGEGAEAAETTALASAGKDHPIFERLREEEIGYRVEETNAACGVRWEMLVRRKWDGRAKLYVPLACPRVCKVKSAAMAVLSSDRFVELMANDRIKTLLEIWHGALSTKRLFVAVVGLQKYLRRAAAIETREFARQMRTCLKDGAASTKGRARSQQAEPHGQLSEEAVEEAVLRLQMTLPWTIWFTQCGDVRDLGRLLWQTTIDLALAEFNGDREVALFDDGEIFGSGLEPPPASPRPGAADFITADVVAALDAAVIRTGTDLADSWIRALTQIPKVTQPVAQSIAALYPTPKRLFEAWRRLESEAECEQLLAQLTVASATMGGRRLGLAMSTRIYRVFNEPDPGRPFAEL